MADIPSHDLSKDDNRGPLVVGILLTVNAFAVSILLCRLFVRTRTSARMGRDDLMLIIGWVLAIGVVVVNFVSIYRDGVGRHIIYLKPEQALGYLKLSLISEVLVVFSNMFVKFSIGLFLLRIFTTRKKRVWLVYSILGFIAVTSVSAAIALLCACIPITKIFDNAVPGRCYSPQVRLAVAYYQGSASALCDTMLAVLPAVFLSDVQIRPKLKIGICCILGLGMLTVACAIVRITLLHDPGQVDFTYWVALVYIWSDLELTVAIMASSIPTLRPLWTMTVTRYRSYSSRKKSGYTIQMDNRPAMKRGALGRIPRSLPHSLWSDYNSNTVHESYASAEPGLSLDPTQKDSSSQIPYSIKKTTVIESSSTKPQKENSPENSHNGLYVE